VLDHRLRGQESRFWRLQCWNLYLRLEVSDQTREWNLVALVSKIKIESHISRCRDEHIEITNHGLKFTGTCLQSLTHQRTCVYWIEITFVVPNLGSRSKSEGLVTRTLARIEDSSNQWSKTKIYWDPVSINNSEIGGFRTFATSTQ